TGYHGRGRSRGAARNPKVVGQRQSNGRLVVESIIEFGSGGRFQETKRLPQYFLLYLRGIRRAKRLPTRKARKQHAGQGDCVGPNAEGIDGYRWESGGFNLSRQ